MKQAKSRDEVTYTGSGSSSNTPIYKNFNMANVPQFKLSSIDRKKTNNQSNAPAI